MRVIFRNVPVDMPDWLADLYLRAGAAHLLEEAVVSTPTDYESRGTPTPRGRRQVTGSKPRNSSNGSRKKTTK